MKEETLVCILIILIFTLIILFGGKPDLMDAIISGLTK